MAIDPTHSEQYIFDSIKKYFVDNLSTVENLNLTFDPEVDTPNFIANHVNEWVAIVLGKLTLDTIAEQELDIYCCTREDAEGYRLAVLRDKVVNYLIDLTKTDGFVRITLYQSHPTNAWVEISKMVAMIEDETPQLDAEDGTKVKLISTVLKWGAK